MRWWWWCVHSTKVLSSSSSWSGGPLQRIMRTERSDRWLCAWRLRPYVALFLLLSVCLSVTCLRGPGSCSAAARHSSSNGQEDRGSSYLHVESITLTHGPVCIFIWLITIIDMWYSKQWKKEEEEALVYIHQLPGTFQRRQSTFARFGRRRLGGLLFSTLPPVFRCSSYYMNTK